MTMPLKKSTLEPGPDLVNDLPPMIVPRFTSHISRVTIPARGNCFGVAIGRRLGYHLYDERSPTRALLPNLPAHIGEI